MVLLSRRRDNLFFLCAAYAFTSESSVQDPADVPAVHRVEAYIGRRLEEQPLPPMGLQYRKILRCFVLLLLRK